VHSHGRVSFVAGLFHRAIIQSGCVLSHWAYDDPSVARRKAFRFGEVLGCHTSDSKELSEFLMKVPAEKLVDAMELSLTEEVRTAC
jgi:carboxylesterase type B